MTKIVTPVATAGYAENIYTLDTEGQYATGKYVFEVRLPKGVEENDAFAKKMTDMAKECGTQHNPLKDGDKVAKTTKSEKRAAYATGHWLIKFKSKSAPKVVDTAKKLLDPNDTKVMGGDKVRVAFDAKPYENNMGNVFLPVYLNAVQLVEKAMYDGNAADAFDDIEGFTSEGGAPAGETDGADF